MSIPIPARVRETALLDALARQLADLGLVRYSPGGVYSSSGLPAVVVGRLPDSPDAAVAINRYLTDERSSDRGNPQHYVQLRWRLPGADPRPVADLADEAASRLHTETPAVWPGGVRLLWCMRHIAAPIELDDTRTRWERADSYRIQLTP